MWLFSHCSQCLSVTLKSSPRITVSEIQIFLWRRAWLIFFCFFHRKSRGEKKCSLHMLVFEIPPLTRSVLGHTHTLGGMSSGGAYPCGNTLVFTDAPHGCLKTPNFLILSFPSLCYARKPPHCVESLQRNL